MSYILVLSVLSCFDLMRSPQVFSRGKRLLPVLGGSVIGTVMITSREEKASKRLLPPPCSLCEGEDATDTKAVVFTAPERSWWSWLTLWSRDKDADHFDSFISNDNCAATKCFSGEETDETDRAREGKMKRSLMLWPSLEEGLKQREKDEMVVRDLMDGLASGQVAGEKEKLEMSQRLSSILYGEKYTIQDRQEFLEKHGCVQATSEILNLINDLTKTENSEKKRGIIEMGIGFGQWARQLVDLFNIDIVAFDNLTNLPLDPRTHNTRSDGYAKYFYQSKVRYGDASVFRNENLKKQYHIDGRILMLIFPDPNSMAIDCLTGYVESSKLNDTLIYVGEGRGGANANDNFFDELETVDTNGNPKWLLLETRKPNAFGEKGYERFFIFKKNANYDTPS